MLVKPVKESKLLECDLCRDQFWACCFHHCYNPYNGERNDYNPSMPMIPELPYPVPFNPDE